ncbi:D-2-hydroxyglutarate dehydrogenase, mitochondrial-like [Haliotis rufescens]|uniref:D-2-hydroxyglutarate dehydrogenase, mitochondrial-like n=1 Tax=Haliotis rufescens TaxID=6454 RepID=UPI00201E7F4A|nr:D-2-hydroxyglutarate dehydrogenase, mitochondrial-like [Haliotis rufescens]
MHACLARRVIQRTYCQGLSCSGFSLPVRNDHARDMGQGGHPRPLVFVQGSRQFHRSCINNSGNTDRKPKIARGPYSDVTDADLSFFESLMPGRVLTDPADVDPYNIDWIKTCKGSSKVVLKPKSTAEVSAILSHCNERKLAVQPQGGNTGLVGGSTPVFDEIILSSQLMNKIISVDDVSGVVVCQSGCVLETLDNYVADYDLVVPLDLGAKGSCHIGGNIATNAGGIRLLRYGSLHGSVLGLEAVLANGKVVDCLSSLRKDNTGYDIKQLFIGSEGTLGFITAASILCPQRPKAVNVALLGCDSFSSLLSVLKTIKTELGEILSAFEMMDNATMEVVTGNLNLTCPISNNAFYALVETSGSNATHDQEKLNAVLEKLMDGGMTSDGTVATDMSKIRAIWQLRERGAEALMVDGYTYKYDFSLNLADFYTLVEDVRERVGAKARRVVGYGHLGDGNLHLNITSSEFNKEILDLIEPFVYDWVSQHGGSVSAEHGLGLWKRNYIYHTKSRAAVDIMRLMKKGLDPNGILNPYKVLPAE